MIQTAVADIVCPAVTAEYPYGTLNKVIGQGQQLFCKRVGRFFQFLFQIGNKAALLIDCRIIGLRITQYLINSGNGNTFCLELTGNFARVFRKLIAG